MEVTVEENNKEVIVDGSKKIALSVFVVAFAFGLNITGVSPILGILSEKYARYGTSTVQLLQTLPYLLLIIGSLIIGWLTTKISKKKIIIYGLFIIGMCGVIPFFTESFEILLGARLLIGFGFGIVGPMNIAVITEFFPPEERASYMGLHVVGMGVGTMAGNLLGGVFAGFGYRYFYLVYLIAFFATFGVAKFLVETPPAKIEADSEMKLNKNVYLISAVSFVHTFFINTYSTNIGIYIMERITDNASVTGIATAVNASAALLIGIFFAKISGILKENTMAVSVFVGAAGYGVMFLLHGITGVYLASVLCGISLSCFMAVGSYLVSISVEQKTVAKASGMFSIIGGMGGLIAPVILGKCAEIFMGKNTAVYQFFIAFIGMFVLGIIVLICMGSRTKGGNENGSYHN